MSIMFFPAAQGSKTQCLLFNKNEHLRRDTSMKSYPWVGRGGRGWRGHGAHAHEYL